MPACSISLFVLKVIFFCCNNYLLQSGDALVFDRSCFTLHTACGRCFWSKIIGCFSNVSCVRLHKI